LLALHQLVDPVADWWDAHVGTHEEPDIIHWNEFQMVFRSHHVHQGIIKLKKKEFENLKQGSMTVSMSLASHNSPTMLVTTWTLMKRSRIVFLMV
jgi:hypothetical protein